MINTHLATITIIDAASGCETKELLNAGGVPIQRKHFGSLRSPERNIFKGKSSICVIARCDSAVFKWE